MATLGELFFGRELVELMDEMEDVLGFSELMGKDADIVDKEITLTIQATRQNGEKETAEISIPPEMERYVRKIVKKKTRLIKRKSGFLSWLLD